MARLSIEHAEPGTHLQMSDGAYEGRSGFRVPNYVVEELGIFSSSSAR